MALFNTNTLVKDKNIKLYLLSILIGVFTGLVVTGYRISLNFVTSIRISTFGKIAQGKNIQLLFITIFVFLLIAVILNQLIKSHPMIKGSGLPQVKGILLMEFEYSWFKELIYKFIGGVLSVGSGLSLGRGGPSIQLGSQVAYGVRKLFKTSNSNINEKFLISSGVSAGLAAAFNSPLTGIVFAIEELHKYITPALFICISLASATAEVVTHSILGKGRLFDFKGIIPNSLAFHENLFFIVILSIITGLLGILFTNSLLKFQKFYTNLKHNKVVKSLFIFIISIFVGIYFLDVQGVGYRLILKAGTTSLSFKLLILLLVGKFLFTILSNAPGFPGGLFLPTLVLGALCGYIFSLSLDHFFHYGSHLNQYFIVLGMASFFTAVMRLPLTANVLLLEMTGSFNYLPHLMLITILTYVFTELLGISPITSILYESLKKQKAIQRKALSKKAVVFSSPVIGGSWLDSMLVKEIKWPKDSLLIKIERNRHDIIPNKNTKIIGGDILYIFTIESKEKELKPIIYDLGTRPKSI